MTAGLGESLHPAATILAGEPVFRPEDWRAVMKAERFYHDPEAVG